MLFNLLLASIAILLCFFLSFLFISNNFVIIPVVKENIKLEFALAIHTGAPIILANKMIDIPPLVADKIIKVLSK